MDWNDFFERAFASTRAMGIFRGRGLEQTLRLCESAWDNGVRVVEVPVMSADDLPVLEAIVAAGRERGLGVGAGTVISVEQVEAVRRAGATFTVAPGLDRDVVAASVAAGLPHIPGVATGTEVQAAVREGLTWLKAFPASELGPGWIRAMHGPFPNVSFVATGGVSAENATGFLDAGCRVVALGSAFEDEQSLGRVAALLAR
ncbi:bifunctional 4-hydroxy-2-oxoglutarate aldolase/2-dehydro-3-deoxy-phosphogluconate aldolase [Agromyces larvae]|uniref:Bifunctional 4-hydroxy-2-oxoglutarate aldolase/2-dehydro-3-deoxy-phosphogluconate aldolase n=1 Tax=Agromyces larvae TaxID=2929802 RepID=A0ABY4C6L8_9MICO|nr:bifunctional 4-hydroxy-2-oxoglutarate aldolase/2-dehydro-3-deoxy-phosphogluconate aldolase [Agromyces larvae]UOE45731.1 bifunctional 4-hydroxy-2-oxoglutarate aldolase/2-dehydro-3-deoxy-phosphogluconate aldolase [Agromyces larvae]